MEYDFLTQPYDSRLVSETISFIVLFLNYLRHLLHLNSSRELMGLRFFCFSSLTNVFPYYLLNIFAVGVGFLLNPPVYLDSLPLGVYIFLKGLNVSGF